MAKNLAKEALQTGTPQRTAPIGAYERRAIHIELAGIEGIETESEGTGEEKNIVIKPK
jgi:spoIIIJ-associated protein